MDPPNYFSSTEVCTVVFSLPLNNMSFLGHTSRPTDFSWAPGEEENWTVASASEDNIVMVWQPTMRVWAGDEVKVDEKELEGEAMEGVEATVAGSSTDKDRPKGVGSGDASLRSQSMDVSAASASGLDD